ncbi:MAG: proteasome accessory factor PafA2 family protein, partial [Candidatus Woesearchaeota archaeon]|nr:proteasome accessory factor PafA2 family protein [Candidatus Woesearchaeota archaeon]
MKRICGLETECGVIVPEPDQNKTINDLCRDSRYALCTVPEKNPERARTHLANGGQNYVDVCALELTTPECQNARELTIYEAAIARAMSGIVPPNVRVIKKNIDSDQLSTGCHENYHGKHLIGQQALSLQSIREQITGFLATRIIFTGAGHFTQDKYYLSGRALATKNAAILGAKDFFSPRAGEDFSNTGIRIHITSGDSNMSEYTNLLKIGTTAIMVTLAENAALSKEFQLKDPLTALHLTNFHGPKAKISLTDGTKITALDYQILLCRKASAFFEEYTELLDSTTQYVLEQWRWVLECLKKNPLQLNRHIDWVIKKWLIDAPTKWTPEEIDVNYHLLSPHGIYYQLLNAGSLARIATEAQLDQAILFPPPTRAERRVKKLLLLPPELIRSITW